MKTLKQFLEEETMPQALCNKEFVGIESEAVRDNINSLIKGVTSKAFITPYVGLERVRKVLAYFHISIPSCKFMQGDYGYNIFNINQFGTKYGQTNDGQIVVKEDSPYSIYFEWQMNEDGMFDVFSEVVTDDELEEILSDYESEFEDDTESEKEYSMNSQQNYEYNKDDLDGLKEEAEQIDEIADTAKGKEAVRRAVHRADATVVDYAFSPPKSKKGKRVLKNAMKTIDRGIEVHKNKGGVLDSYLKRAYGLKKEETDKPPFEPTKTPSTPYRNPSAKSKQLARQAMRKIKKDKEEKRD